MTGRQDIILPSGEVIHFSLELEAVTGNLTQEEAGPQHRDLSLVYENTGDGSEGVLTYSPDTGTVQYSTVQYSTVQYSTVQRGCADLQPGHRGSVRHLRDRGHRHHLHTRGGDCIIFLYSIIIIICDPQSLDHLGYVVWVEVDQDSLSHAEDTMEDIPVDPMEDMTKDTMRQDVAPDTRTAALLARGAEDRETVRVDGTLCVLLI